MSLPEVATREQWLHARKALLEREKEFTRQKDLLNADRRRLPMVAVEKDYTFEGPQGTATLADLFDGQRQLVVYHFMFDPSWDDGCSSCTAGCDELSAGLLEHLGARSTAYAVRRSQIPCATPCHSASSTPARPQPNSTPWLVRRST